MPSPVNCSPCCSTATTTQIPGPAGSDATVIAPGIVDPNGAVVGNPGQIYCNTSTHTLWVKETGTATNTGWVEYIGASA